MSEASDYFKALDWVVDQQRKGHSLKRIEKMINFDARNPTGPDPEDIRKRTSILFYFEKGRTKEVIEAEIAKMLGVRE
ncbi:MAG: hypothetical protein WAV09_03050 [Minisyncoccia bacterium]